MPAPRFKPFLANEPSTSDEVATLELFLKKQLEDDVARIFDESIYSDFEVVCGKSKILTHSCILKARTNQFFHKLEAILHVNIDRNTFDEIYSYISDVYTECDIKNQEKQILSYLKSNVKLSDVRQSNKNKEDVIDSDIFLTPKCLSPYIENKFEPSSCLSPSVEVTKQYYALVPGNLEQELNEQDALSSAFKTIIETQDKELSKTVKRSKPSSLSLSSSHSSQIKRSSSCDILNKTSCDITNIDNSCHPNKHFDSDFSSKIKSEDCSDSLNDKVDQAYSPDSLITDDPSSSSDYLSAAHTFSPGVNTTGFLQLNVGENINKVDNIFTSSDSGFENTGMMESLSSHKDVTLTDLSMTESIIQDIMPLDTNEALNSSAACTEQSESYYLFSCNSSNVLSSSAIPKKDNSLQSYTSDKSDGGTINNSIDKANETPTNVRKSRYNESTPILSGGSLLESVESLKSTTQPNSPSIRRKVDNIPIVTGSFFESEPNIRAPKPPKTNSSSAWVIDLTATEEKEVSRQDLSLNKPCDRTCESLKSEVRSCSTSENCSKSRSSVDSDGSEKSSHKFYIDFSSIPDPLPQDKTVNNDNKTEKKNMFSMYIDFNNSGTVKEKPRRLSSNPKKSTSDMKCNKSEKTDNKVATSDTTAIKPNVKGEDNKGTFEMYESLCNNLNICISDIIAETNVVPKTDISDTNAPDTVEEISIKAEIKTAPVIHEELENAEPPDEFVKLSDLDKPVLKPDIDPHIPETKKNYDDRMTRSIPENNWGEAAYTVTSRSIEVISSFHSENALSLNRLFPHLKNEFSKSMPITFSGRTRSPFKSGVPSSTGEIDEQTSDVSEISSVQSSMCRSVIENSTTEDTSQSSNIIGNSQSRLGQDLLRMFLEEIAPDVIVEVSGKRIKAHKCILSSRCQYFAGILSGGWVESAGNIIVLPPFSFNVVHFALCHIYSGLSTIPDSISIVELATIADMLGLEGLKEAIMYTLKSKYCHHFHTPCQVCTAGVLECFPLSSVYGLDDLYRKCLRWITKHFSTVWPTKAFATLPKELLDKCYLEHLNNFKTENVIDTVYGCGITVATLHNSRWAEIVENMCRRLVNAAAQFLAKNLLDFFKLIATIPADAPHAAKDALDNCLSAAIEWAPPEETCKSYAFLSNVVGEIKSQHLFQPDLITNSDQIWRTLEQNSLLYTSATTWRLQCESALVRAAPRVVGLQAFKDLPPDLRKRLRELGCIMYGPQVIATTSLQERKTRSKSEKLSSSPASRSLDMEKVRASFVPYKAKPVNVMGSIDELKCNEYRDIKKQSKRNPPKIRTTKAQEERAKYNQSKTRSQPVKQSSVGPVTFQNTKPRYLDPRIRKERDKKSPTESSESSRNSSPIKCRNSRISRLESKREHRIDAISQDSLASTSRPRTAEPSTDSLSESQISNKYATYTKVKHKNKRSIEQIPANFQVLTHTHSKTKIPVYVNQKLGPANGSKPYEPSKPIKIHSLSSHNGTNRNCLGGSPRIANRHHESRKLTITKNPSISMCNSLPNKDSKSNFNDKKTKEVSRSLMNATKSSSAKMVPRATKEVSAKKPTKAVVATKKNVGKQEKHINNGLTLTKDMQVYVETTEIPPLERSSTFSKDEPTFDKMENVDDKV